MRMIPKMSQGKRTVKDGIRRTAYLLLAVILWIPLLSIGEGKAWAASGWSMIDGGSLSMNSGSVALYSTLAVWNGEVYVAWQESNQIRVKKYNGSGWDRVDGNGPNGLNMDTAKAGSRPTLAVFDGSLYIAWVEMSATNYKQIRVKKYIGGTSWDRAEGSATGINYSDTNSADSPALVEYNHYLYAAWTEAGKIRVKRYNGGEWTSVDRVVDGGADGLNKDLSKTAGLPALAVAGNELFIVWSEINGVYQLRAKKFDGTTWTWIDGNGPYGLNKETGKGAVNSSLAVFNGVLYAAWNEPVNGTTDDQIRVKKYVDNAWSSVDGDSPYGINEDYRYRAHYVKLAASNRDLYAVWQESYNGTTTFKIRVKKYNGTGWTSAEAGSGGLLAEPSRSAEFPVITTLNNTVFVAWHEKNASNELLRSANYTPPAVNGVTVTPGTATVRQGESRQLNVTVDAVGGATATVDWTSSDGSNKVAVDGTGKVTVAADADLGDYTITATSTVDGSKQGTATITVTEGLATEATPAAVVDYVAEQLTNLEPNTDYDIDGTTVTADGGGKTAINGSWLGKSVSVVKKGNGTTTADSSPQTLSLPARPASPTAGKTDETTINGNNGTLTSVTTAMEYKQGSTGSWTDIAGTSVTGLAPDTYYVRVKATSSAFASNSQTVTIATFNSSSEATPAADVDYATEELTGLEPNGDYDIDGTTVTADGSGKVSIDSGWLGRAVNVVKKGNGTTTTDSLPQTLSLPARPATPTAGKTDETVIDGNNGTLTSVTTAMEYKQGSTGSWTGIVGTSVTGLAPDTYYVRVKATSSAFASNPQTVTIATFNASSEATPAAEVDYATEELTGLEPNGEYDIDGKTVTADGSGKAAIAGSWLGKTVSVVKKGNGATTTDSSPQTISLPARPAAPVDISVTDITYNGANDGSIVNVNVAMEYRKGDNGSWTRATGTYVDGLENGVYYVRVAATESSFASIPAQATIHDSNATIPEAPNVNADDTNNAIVGLDTTMEFSVDGGPYIRYDGTNAPQLDGERTVQVRVAASGSVPAGPSTTLTFTTNVAVPASGLTVTASDPSGTANDGKTKITVTPDADGGHRLVYFNFGSNTVIVPNVGDVLNGYPNVPSDGMIPAASGDKIGIAEVDALERVVRFGQTAAIVIAEPPAPPTVIDTPTEKPGSKEETVNVLVNGKVENAGKAVTKETGGIKTTTIIVDPVKLQAKLEAEGVNAVVTIPVQSDSNVIVGELNGQMIKKMEDQSATLVLQTDKATYTLPAREIAIDEVARKLGGNVNLEDIRLQISVANTPATMAQVVENAAKNGEFSVVVPALDFTVTGAYGGNTVEVTTFNAYVERMVILPEGIDPNRITTGIVVEPDGTVRHVPTKIVLKDGRYYATINSLTNSTYSVVWHPLEFDDVANHWSKAAVNDMGSRMGIDGTGDGRFSPDRAITRAEFAAILVRGLGLKLEESRPTAFSDVKTKDWYNSAINTAYAYDLINGYDDGTFRPNDEITREEVMAIISRAMSITGLEANATAQSIDQTLRSYRDASNVSGWARSSVAINVQTGLVSGRSTSLLAPTASITRAEAATVIRRLLQASDLIN